MSGSDSEFSSSSMSDSDSDSDSRSVFIHVTMFSMIKSNTFDVLAFMQMRTVSKITTKFLTR